MIASDALILWLANGERGISSNTIVEYLTGIPCTDGCRDHPRNPQGLRQCRLLLEKVPELVAQFHRMARLSPEWAALVREWDGLCKQMDDEVPRWREHGNWRAPRTFDAMDSIIFYARRTG